MTQEELQFMSPEQVKDLFLKYGSTIKPDPNYQTGGFCFRDVEQFMTVLTRPYEVKCYND